MADEFNQLTERIQETDAMRRQFVADASHELKTPLTSIRLLSDSILQDPEMEPELIREFVGDIGREAQRLSRITEGLLSLTRLDRGIQEQSGVIDVSGQVRYAIHLLLPLAEANDIVLHSQLESNCPGAHLWGQHGSHRQQSHRERHQVQRPRRQCVDPAGHRPG